MCTSLTLMPDNRSGLLARTMDFSVNLEADFIVVPRNYPLLTTQPGPKPLGTYGFMGKGRKYQTHVLADGLNEAGLACASLYFSGYAKYNHEALENKINLAPEEVVAWMLASFSTIQEAKAAVLDLNILDKVNDHFGITLPLHWIVSDRSGASIVIEPMEGGLIIHDNPLGVMTNSPDFNWHLTNIRNYIGVNQKSVNPIELGGLRFAPFGSGGGSFGLPGDYTPPARFLRAVFGKETINPVEDEEEGVTAVFHILASVDIPKGNVIADEGINYTQYTACMAVASGNYYFKTYDNNQLIKINLFDQNLDAKEPRVYPVCQVQNYGTLV